MAVSTAERVDRRAPAAKQGSGGGEFLLVGGLFAGLAALLLLESRGKASTSSGACPCEWGATPAGCADENGNCFCALPIGTLVQDPSQTISIIDVAPAGSNLPCVRRSIVTEANGTRCGYDYTRLLQISDLRREAIPLGADVPLTGSCPPQLGEEDAPIGT